MSGISHTTTLWEESIHVKSYEVDSAGKLRLASLFNYFQETAGNHATHLGAGYEKLHTLGFYWVLSRAKVRINRLPEWREVVTLTTWPKGQDGLLFVRDFRMTDEGGEMLVRGSTGWLLMDAARNKPQPAGVLDLKIPANEHGHAIDEPLRKLKQPGGMTRACERSVLPGDLDVNKHVNNARYLEWITDCLEIRRGTSNAVSAFQINYVGEAVLGDSVTLNIAEDPAIGGTYVEGTHGTTGLKIVQAVVEWK